MLNRSILAAAALALVCMGSASGAVVRSHTTDDQSAANAAILHRADLGADLGWKGAVQKVDVSKAGGALSTTCPGLASGNAAGVVSAAAGSRFSNSGLELISAAAVFPSVSMASRDLRGSQGAAYEDCIRRFVAVFFESDPSRVALTRLALPNVATATVAYRGVTTFSTRKRRYLLDLVTFRRGRTESLLAVVLPAADPSLATKADLLYARIVAGHMLAH
jgi:hypothetical protein